MLYQINKGTFSYGADTVFKDIQFEINENEKIAIIGRNGCGKSTLLQVILGQLTLDSGNIHKQNGIVIQSISQIVFKDTDITIEDELLKVYEPLKLLQEELEKITKKMENDHSDQILNKYAKLSQEFEEKGGYTYRSEMLTIFTKFGFENNDLTRKISTLSGGQQTRLAFVKLLISKPDILLLDEPTNHLDMQTIQWLEGYIKKYPKAVVIVSHDRVFLDNVAQYIYEIEYENMTKYTGNYSSFVIQKKQNQDALERAYKNQVKEIERLNALIEKFRYKKNKAAFAQSKIKYLQRMDKIELIQNDDKKFKAKFECGKKGGKNVLTLDRFAFGYDHVLAQVTLDILKGQRIAVVGKNGHGKSTFLKTIIGNIDKLGGEMLLGHQIEIGYFDQHLLEFSNNDNTVLEELWNEDLDMSMTQVRSILGSFLFSADDVFKNVNVLSQGEKVRLFFAKLTLRKPNFLILDEPTNHLDILGKEALEEALQDYDGTILFVSHDRYFIQKIATNILRIEDGKATYYPYGYQQFIDDENVVNVNEKEQEAKSNTCSRSKRSFSTSAIRKIEEKINQLEKNIEQLKAKTFEEEYYQDHIKLNELENEIDLKENELLELMDKWENMQI